MIRPRGKLVGKVRVLGGEDSIFEGFIDEQNLASLRSMTQVSDGIDWRLQSVTKESHTHVKDIELRLLFTWLFFGEKHNI